MDLDDILMPQVSKQLHFWLGLRGASVTEDLFPREMLLAALVLDLFHLEDGRTFRKDQPEKTQNMFIKSFKS